jgi:hypothetical protein
MLPWGQCTIVGVTLYDRSHSRTIYCHREDLLGSKFGASLDGQMSHRARSRCTSRLASRESEISQRNNEQATNRIVVFLHTTDYLRSGLQHKYQIYRLEFLCIMDWLDEGTAQCRNRWGLQAAHRSYATRKP